MKGKFDAYVKFTYSEKATKCCKIFPLLLTVCTDVKSKGKISQNFVAFSEYMNFKLPIDAYQLSMIFQGKNFYLIHPAKEIFQKFPKMVILEFILILPQVFYLVDSTQVKKTVF